MSKLAIVFKILLIAAVLTGAYLGGINYAASQALEKFKIDQAISFIKWGAAVDVTTSGRYTALALCSQSPDYLPEMNWLLAHGADVNGGASSGHTPLIEMAQSYSDEAGEPKIADRLIRAGAKIDGVDQYGMTALALACSRGKSIIAAWLIRHGANVNSGNKADNMPFWCAIESAERPGSSSEAAIASLVNILLDRGADPNGRSDTLAIFKALPHPAIVAVLLDHGIRVDAIGHDGLTPIQEAAKLGYADVIPILVAHHSDPNAPDRFGETPLAIARCVGEGGTIGDYKATYHALLKAGANPHTPSTPFSTVAGPWPGAPPPPPVPH